MSQRAIARQGDATTCGGSIIGPCASKWKCNGARMARKSADYDTCGVCYPPLVASISTGSSNWKTQGYAQAGVTDIDGCVGAIAQGSPNWSVNT